MNPDDVSFGGRLDQLVASASSRVLHRLMAMHTTPAAAQQRDPFRRPLFGDMFIFTRDMTEFPADITIFLGLDSGSVEWKVLQVKGPNEDGATWEAIVETTGPRVRAEDTYLGNCCPDGFGTFEDDL